MTIWKKLLRFAIWLVGGAVALVVVAYLGLLAINWRDRPASEAALKLSAVYRDRPQVSDADNGFVYAMGFGIGRAGDPYAAGVRRIEWLRHIPDDPYVPLSGDPVESDFEYKAGRTPAVTKLSEACQPDFHSCASAMEGADEAVGEWLQSEEWLLDRYLALLERGGWLEPVPFDVRAPLPAYSMVADGQKLLLSRAWVLAGRKDAAGARQLLAEDLRFWRQVLESSDNLITKMIAVASLKRHFGMGSLVLRKLPPALVDEGLPEEWTRELSRSERSLMRCLTGELMFSSQMIRHIKAGTFTRIFAGENADEGPMDRLLAKASSPMLQPQDSINLWAQQFIRLVEVLDVPFEEYPAALERADALTSEAQGEVAPFRRMYNLMGNGVFSESVEGYVSYGPLVMDLEGIRRAAVLTAELRSRNVSADEVPDQLLSTGIRVPYTGEPFTWDAKERAIVFTGLVPGERGRHPFRY